MHDRGEAEEEAETDTSTRKKSTRKKRTREGPHDLLSHNWSR
jgi:hypothetical protein